MGSGLPKTSSFGLKSVFFCLENSVSIQLQVAVVNKIEPSKFFLSMAFSLISSRWRNSFLKVMISRYRTGAFFIAGITHD